MKMLLPKNVSSSENVHDTDVHDISYETTRILIFIIYTVICQTIDIFGIVTNIINIVCFVKQGFKEPINISLLGLAISDMCLLLTLLITSIIFTLIFSTTNLPFDVMGVFSLIVGHPHTAFTRITSWITALITLERCLCIVAPMKVKDIVTPRRVCIIIVSVYIILLFSLTPVYLVNRLDMIFVRERNITVLGLVSSKNRDSVEKISFIVNNFSIPLSACIVIITCTIILVISLSKTSEWRKTSMKLEDVSNRNQRVSKMVTMISTLFVCCFVPVMTILLALAFVPGLKAGGGYVNTSIVAFSAGFILESINSSSNIFIYYNMSSKYRNTFHSIFWKIRSSNDTNIKKFSINTIE